MFLKRGNEGVGQYRHAVFVSFDVSYDELALGKVHVFDAQPDTF